MSAACLVAVSINVFMGMAQLTDNTNFASSLLSIVPEGNKNDNE
jgi:hypothetical protein